RLAAEDRRPRALLARGLRGSEVVPFRRSWPSRMSQQLPGSERWHRGGSALSPRDRNPAGFGRELKTALLGRPRDERKLLLVGDLIVDRLVAAKYWKSRTDWEQAVLLLRAHQNRVDSASLERKAGQNDVADWLENLIRAIEAGAERPPRPKNRAE